MRLWKFESTITFWKCERKVVLLVIYLFNYDSSKWVFFMLNYGITFSWGFSWVQFLSNKLEFFVSGNDIKGYKVTIWSLQEHLSFCSVCFDLYFFLKKGVVLHRGDYNFLFWQLCQIHTFNNNLNDEEWYHLTWWAYRKSGTLGPGPIRGTRDPSPETLYLGPNPGHIGGTQDPGSLCGTLHLKLGTRDSICGN